MHRDDPTMAWDIWNAIQRIKEYTEGLTREAFEANPLYQDAIVRQFEVLGEAARQLSNGFGAAHPEIDWPK